MNSIYRLLYSIDEISRIACLSTYCSFKIRAEIKLNSKKSINFANTSIWKISSNHKLSEFNSRRQQNFLLFRIIDLRKFLTQLKTTYALIMIYIILNAIRKKRNELKKFSIAAMCAINAHSNFQLRRIMNCNTLWTTRFIHSTKWLRIKLNVLNCWRCTNFTFLKRCDQIIDYNDETSFANWLFVFSILNVMKLILWFCKQFDKSISLIKIKFVEKFISILKKWNLKSHCCWFWTTRSRQSKTIDKML